MLHNYGVRWTQIWEKKMGGPSSANVAGWEIVHQPEQFVHFWTKRKHKTARRQLRSMIPLIILPLARAPPILSGHPYRMVLSPSKNLMK